MTEIETNILASLIELDDGVRAMRTADPKPDLQALFARVDGLAGQLPGDADPQLRHFLERRSYEKARLLLEGRGAENARGACGGA